MVCHDKGSLKTEFPGNEVTQKAKGLDRDLRGQAEVSTDLEELVQVDDGVTRWALVESVETGKDGL